MPKHPDDLSTALLQPEDQVAQAILLAPTQFTPTDHQPEKRLAALLDLLQREGLPPHHPALLVWIGLRILRPNPGERIRLPDSCPIAAALAYAAGAHPDPTATTGIGPSESTCPIRIAPQHATLHTPAGGLAIAGMTGAPLTPGDWPSCLAAISPLPLILGRPAWTTGDRRVLHLPIRQMCTTPANPVHSLHPWTPQITTDQPLPPHPSQLVTTLPFIVAHPPAPTEPVRLTTTAIQSGLISDAQFEAVARIIEAHETILSCNQRIRQGFLLADGWGTGKTHIALATLLHYRLSGRPRAILVLAHPDDLAHWRNIWARLGEDPALLQPALTPTDRRTLSPEGIAVLDWPSMGSCRFTQNLHSLIRWAGPAFDGLLIFDEAQRLMYAHDDGHEFRCQAYAGVRLQTQLPSARVLYLAAANAMRAPKSSPHIDLSSFDRLPQTHSNTLTELDLSSFDRLPQTHSNTLTELAQRGLCLVRHLDCRDLDCQEVRLQITDAERAALAATIETWHTIQSKIHDVFVAAGLDVISSSNTTPDHPELARMLHAIQTLAQNPDKAIHLALLNLRLTRLIPHIREAINHGERVILQIPADLSSTQPPSPQLADFLAYLPTVPWTQTGGSDSWMPAPDNHQQAAILNTTRAAFERLIRQTLPMPALADILAQAFGADRIANLQTIQDDRNARARLLAAFETGTRPILLLNEPGQRHLELHCRSNEPGARHLHILLETDPIPDRCLQALFRSHRTGQTIPPRFLIPTLDVPADRMRLVDALHTIEKTVLATTKINPSPLGTAYAINETHYNSSTPHLDWKVLRRLNTILGHTNLPKNLKRFQADYTQSSNKLLNLLLLVGASASVGQYTDNMPALPTVAVRYRLLTPPLAITDQDGRRVLLYRLWYPHKPQITATDAWRELRIAELYPKQTGLFAVHFNSLEIALHIRMPNGHRRILSPMGEEQTTTPMARCEWTPIPDPELAIKPWDIATSILQQFSSVIHTFVCGDVFTPHLYGTVTTPKDLLPQIVRLETGQTIHGFLYRHRLLDAIQKRLRMHETPALTQYLLTGHHLNMYTSDYSQEHIKVQTNTKAGQTVLRLTFLSGANQSIELPPGPEAHKIIEETIKKYSLMVHSIISPPSEQG